MYEGFLALGIAAGGQLTTTDEVENFPGFTKVQGATLMVRQEPDPYLKPSSETNGGLLFPFSRTKCVLKTKPVALR